MTNRSLLITLMCALMLLSTPAGAQDATTQATLPAFPRPGTYDREMDVSPASADGPSAAPRDALSPDSLTFTRDNAAPLYLAAGIQIPNFWQSDRRLHAMDDRLQNSTPETINAAEAEEYLSHFERPFQTIAPAVHRPRVAWEWPWHEQGYSTLLPHLNQMRYIGNTFTFRAKLDLSRDDFPAALSRMKQAYVMAHHAGGHDEAVLVEGLVGVGIAAQATRHLGFVSERPGAPNLYRALLALPEPMFRPRTWVEMEHRMFRESAPALYEPEAMDEAAWIQVWRQFGFIGLSPESWNYDKLPYEEQVRVARALAAARREMMLPVAIEYFVARGGDAAVLRAEAKQNPYPLLARYMTGTMDDFMDEAAALVQLPFDDALPRLEALASEAEKVQWWHDSNPDDRSEDSLAPPFDRGLLSIQRLRQSIAGAIVLEALRDHAAAHGQWPDSLAELRLYVADDPISGKPFEYRRDGDKFILLGAQDRPNSGFEWHVTLRR